MVYKILCGSLCSVCGYKGYMIKTRLSVSPMRAYVGLDGNIFWVDEYDYDKVLLYKPKKCVYTTLLKIAAHVDRIVLGDIIPGTIIFYKGALYLTTIHWYDEEYLRKQDCIDDYSFAELMLLRTHKAVCALNLENYKLEYLLE